MNVLITEDEPHMAALLRQALTEEGLDVDVAPSGEAALVLIQTQAFDAILLDVMLPGLKGFETCRRIRDKGVGTPILMLTARDAVEDRVTGLDAGADDYLAKPFSLEELLARVRALLRRGPAEFGARLAVADLVADTHRFQATRRGDELALTSREFSILVLLMRNAGRVVTRAQIIEHAWEDEPEHNSNVVAVLVKRIREKIDRPYGLDSIEAIRGVGYRMRQQ